MEECAEVQHIASKAIQFGLDEVKQGGTKSNFVRLEEEVTDLLNTLKLFDRERGFMHLDLTEVTLPASLDTKISRLEHYKALSNERGMVQGKKINTPKITKPTT